MSTANANPSAPTNVLIDPIAVVNANAAVLLLASSTPENLAFATVLSASGSTGTTHLTGAQIAALINAGLTPTVYAADTSTDKISNLCDIFTITSATPPAQICSILVHMLNETTGIWWVVHNKIQFVLTNLNITPAATLPYVIKFWSTWDTLAAKAGL